MASRFHAQFEHWVAAMSPAERTGLLKGLPALLRAIRQRPGG
jgi:hypothetical protein